MILGLCSILLIQYYNTTLAPHSLHNILALIYAIFKCKRNNKSEADTHEGFFFSR